MHLSIHRRAVVAALATTALAGAFVCGVAATPAGAATAPKPASAVPWSKVGSGWTMATWAASPKATSQRLYLVAPGGTRYLVARGLSTHADLVDWTSARGGRALIGVGNTTREIDLRTGARHTIPGLTKYSVLGYNRPAARSLLVVPTVSTGNPRLMTISLTGKRLVTYPSSVHGSGMLYADDLVLQPGSSGAVVLGAQHGLAVLGPRGHLTRRLATSLAQCVPQSVLRTGVVVARCKSNALYAVATDGSFVRRLTPARTSAYPMGFSDIWNYSRGRLALAPTECGPEQLVRFDPKGRTGMLHPKAPVRGSGITEYTGHHGDVVEALFHSGSCRYVTTTLFGYNAVTHRSTALLGPGVNGGTVNDDLPWIVDRVI